MNNNRTIIEHNWKVRNPHWGWPAPHHPSQLSCVRPAHPVRWLRLALSILLRLSFCILHFAFCILFFAQVDVFHHLENINLLITIVIIISALMMINNRVLIVNYSQGTPEIHGQVNICTSVWRSIFNMCDVSYLEIIVIYDNYFVCLCWSLYQTPVRPLRLEWYDSGLWR